MAEYRVYMVDTDDHFFDTIHLICADDAEAIEQARGWPSIMALSFGSLTEKSRYSRIKPEVLPAVRYNLIRVSPQRPAIAGSLPASGRTHQARRPRLLCRR